MCLIFIEKTSAEEAICEGAVMPRVYGAEDETIGDVGWGDHVYN